MADLRDIRRRSATVRSTQQITGAMEMVAAAKLRRAEAEVRRFRPYAHALSDLMRHVARDRCLQNRELLRIPGESKRMQLLAVTSNRGLCAGFNANVAQRTAEFLFDDPARPEEAVVTVVGRKGHDLLKREGVSCEICLPMGDPPKNEEVAAVVEHLTGPFVRRESDSVWMVFNLFRNRVRQEVVVERLLPVLSREELAASEEEASEATGRGSRRKRPRRAPRRTVQYEFLPDPDTLLDRLLPLYLETEVRWALYESRAAEHGARMTAMQNANEAGDEMLKQLTLEYNRARQRSITRELMEIVSGAEALR